MINQSTTDKLIEMRLTAMADAFRIQTNDCSMKDISFEDRFGIVYCILKIPTIAEVNPESCMRIFPMIADAFGISLRPQ